MSLVAYRYDGIEPTWHRVLKTIQPGRNVWDNRHPDIAHALAEAEATGLLRREALDDDSMAADSLSDL